MKKRMVIGFIVLGCVSLGLSWSVANASEWSGPCDGDFNGDGAVTIDEILRSVNNAPTGCPCRVVVGFDGLQTSVRQCGRYSIGEDLSSQFIRLGVVFAVNGSGVAYGATVATTGGVAGATGDPIVGVGTVDETRCFSTTAESGVLTARFVDPGSQASRSVGGVRVLVTDTERSVGVRARDAEGRTVQDCPNIFLSCPLVVSTLANGTAVNLRFPGEDIVTVEFIDEGKGGFTLDDLSYVRPVPECAETP